MDILNLNLLPEWEHRWQHTNKGEEWKWKEELQIGESYVPAMAGGV
jgi:hypothetical protein